MNRQSYEWLFIQNQNNKVCLSKIIFREETRRNMAYHLCTVHPETINDVAEKMQSAYALSKMSNFLKVMADPTRLRIVNALLIRELCVCDIAALLGMEHSAVSHQLAVLRKIDVVNVRQEGKVKYYSLSDDHISTVFQVTLTHINE